MKKGKTDKCVYHPAPLTKTVMKASLRSNQAVAGIEAEQSPSSGTTPMTASATYIAYLEQTTRPTGFSSIASLTQPESTLTASTSTPSLKSPSRQSDGPMRTSQATEKLPGHAYLDAQRFENGASFISHSAVLAENESSIGLSPPGSSTSTVSQAYIDKGVAVLELLQDLSSIQKYIDKWFSFAGGVVVIEPMVKIWLDGLWSTWHKILENSSDLRGMSAQVWENTSKPLSQLLKRDTTPRDFCTSMTGANLRWEIVGIIFSLVSLLAQSLKGKSTTEFLNMSHC